MSEARRPVHFYDGDCGVCAAFVATIERALPAVLAVPFHALGDPATESLFETDILEIVASKRAMVLVEGRATWKGMTPSMSFFAASEASSPSLHCSLHLLRHVALKSTFMRELRRIEPSSRDYWASKRAA